MLAILMGLIAWVVDALVGWILYPDVSFVEILVDHDPNRTVFMRSIVVVMFFLLGLITGHLMSRLEDMHARERSRNRMLRGIINLHESIVRVQEEEELLEVAAEQMKSAFRLERVQFEIFPHYTRGDEDVDPEQMRSLLETLGCGEYHDHLLAYMRSK
ncbi:MAG: hypothetical protein GVY28_05390, partial [Alphaproteobacteria bacterium]|nr:hypothetical protein [Alphaproteobacteria bacterium]